LQRDGFGSEDLLLGLLRLPRDSAALALSGAGVTLAGARAGVEFFGLRETPPAGGPGDTAPSAQKALLLASDEAQREGADSIRPSHVLLGLLRQKGSAVSVLNWLGLGARDLDDIRRSVSKGSAPA
jgi:ATP-dependent Clp protease ATP-binding subunit ClpA